MQNELTGWVVVGSYQDESGEWVTEIMAEGFEDQNAANRARVEMSRRCPEVRFEALGAAYWHSV